MRLLAYAVLGAVLALSASDCGLAQAAGGPKLVSRTEPVYPPIAKAAHISGDVKLELLIDSAGHVISSKAVSGPAMLFGAAMECVKAWLYEPIDSGNAHATATVSFALPGPINRDDEKIGAEFFAVDRKCIDAVAANTDPATEAEVCSHAARIAEQFSTADRFIERRSAYVYASTALLRNRQLNESLAYANKAIGVVAQGHDDGSGSSAAYSTRAQVLVASGDLQHASEDLTKAEDFERLGIAKMMPLNAEFAKHQYIPVLRNLLKFQAQVLEALNDKPAAAAKIAEADKL